MVSFVALGTALVIFHSQIKHIKTCNNPADSYDTIVQINADAFVGEVICTSRRCEEA